MTGFILKNIALVTMVLDHIKYAIPEASTFITQYFGRISYPIFAFLITEGVVHTSDLKKYYKRLLIFACISQIPFMLFRTLVSDKLLLNIMFTFLFAITGIIIFEDLKSRKKCPLFFRIILISLNFIFILIMGTYVSVDYGWYGIAVVWIFYLFRDKKILRTFLFFLLVFIYYLFAYHLNINSIDYLKVVFTSIPGILVLFYNGKEGIKLKYFFYLFYPIHLLIIYCIYLIR